MHIHKPTGKEGHVLRRMLDAPVPGKRQREEDRKPGGKTHVKEIWKVWVKDGGCIGQDKVEEIKFGVKDGVCDG